VLLVLVVLLLLLLLLALLLVLALALVLPLALVLALLPELALPLMLLLVLALLQVPRRPGARRVQSLPGVRRCRCRPVPSASTRRRPCHARRVPRPPRLSPRP
jgi:hypothetical protein